MAQQFLPPIDTDTSYDQPVPRSMLQAARQVCQSLGACKQCGHEPWKLSRAARFRIMHKVRTAAAGQVVELVRRRHGRRLAALLAGGHASQQAVVGRCQLRDCHAAWRCTSSNMQMSSCNAVWRIGLMLFF